MALTQRFQPGGQFSIQRDSNIITHIVTQFRSWPVCRQRQKFRRTPEMGHPEFPLLLQHLTLKIRLLPAGIITEPDWQFRQRIRQPLNKGSVECAQFSGKNPHRPAIRNDVVHSDFKNMLLLTLMNQLPTDQRTIHQIKFRLKWLVFRCHLRVVDFFERKAVVL
ncbi:hypothetical protein VA7868_04390 [Vibrio aerogenes CECT 7868]|uniref:Uncharacterized protein n=1 Tax=Vibrio aerogenes CECT 7868 TaxID=1216006 RepID=A0A1M6E7A7_9VIBR|nr:hypothetical protein VA7868_04390 [Vibrio aerogenes CECT 7868]